MLVLGPAHAGKSQTAIQMLAPDREACVIGMGHAASPWMVRRHAELRELRPPSWRLIEGQQDLSGAFQDALSTSEQVLIDSVSQWIGAMVHELGAATEPHKADEVVIPRLDELLRLVKSAAATHRLVIVTSEAGAGPPPGRAQDWSYRRLVGLANQRLAALCTTVVTMTAGIPAVLKGP